MSLYLRFKIFAPVVNHIATMMNGNSLCYMDNGGEFLAPLKMLRQLCEIKREQTNPVCNLVCAFHI